MAREVIINGKSGLIFHSNRNPSGTVFLRDGIKTHIGDLVKSTKEITYIEPTPSLKLLDSNFECLDRKVERLSVEDFYDGVLGGDLEIEGSLYNYNYNDFTEFLDKHGIDEESTYDYGTDTYTGYCYSEHFEPRYYLVKDNDKIIGYINESLIWEFRRKEPREISFPLRKKLER